MFNAVRSIRAAAAGYRAPNAWQAVERFIAMTGRGLEVLNIANKFERSIAGQWERGSFSSAGKGWRVSFTRGPASQTRTLKDYPLKQFYTQEEIDALSMPEPVPKAIEKRPPVYFDESAIGGAFDGRQVSSDADPGL